MVHLSFDRTFKLNVELNDVAQIVKDEIVAITFTPATL